MTSVMQRYAEIGVVSLRLGVSQPGVLLGRGLFTAPPCTIENVTLWVNLL